MNTFKCRFSPSPTGLMHIGNFRTGLFNYLWAQQQQGIFLLRIEDTDKVRSTQAYSQSLMENLHWLGIHWTDGPHYQSDRHPIYEQYYQQLLSEKKAYYCFCTDVELQLARRNCMQQGKPPRYQGTCRDLSMSECQAKWAKGLKPSIRYKIGVDRAIPFNDLVQGPKMFQSQDIGDFIIKKNDDTASFMFCNALDDALMKTTHVLRGEDHLTNTPRQLLILEALGLKAPIYAHMALIVGADAKPLSKRNGSFSVEELRDQGFLPIAIINYLARLGHSMEAEYNQTLLTLDELALHFKIDKLSRSPARFDYGQLLYWQKMALAALDPSALCEWAKGAGQYAFEFIALIKDNIHVYEDIRAWSERIYAEKLDYSEHKAALVKAGPRYFDIAIESIQQNGADKNTILKALEIQLSLKGAALMMPLRVSVSGVSFGPELDKLVNFLGENILIKRLKQARDFIEAS